jgi:hypothetical protein
MNIMPPRRLSVLNSSEVASPNMLDIFIGSPPRHLLIFTGIAMPVLESNGQLDGQEITIDLNKRSNVRFPPFTAVVGLASIYNEDSDLIFATDDVRVTTDEAMNLFLVCNIAVMGDSSVLHRFSYQATVFTEADNGTISGSIRWNPHFMTFDPNGNMGNDLFLIEAFAVKFLNNPDGFISQSLQLQKTGHTIGPPLWMGRLMGISYEIKDLPIGVKLVVKVTAKPGAFLITNSKSNFSFIQVSGPSIIELNQVHLVENPVDFEAREDQVGLH